MSDRSNRAQEIGAGLTEYILLVSLIGIASVGLILLYGDDLRGLYSASDNALAGQEEIVPATRAVDNLTAKNLKNFANNNEAQNEHEAWLASMERAIEKEITRDDVVRHLASQLPQSQPVRGMNPGNFHKVSNKPSAGWWDRLRVAWAGYQVRQEPKSTPLIGMGVLGVANPTEPDLETLGEKYPNAFYTDKFAAFPLWHQDPTEDHPIDPNDMKQGSFGDCWWESPILMMAAHPKGREYLISLFQATSDGNWVVRIHKPYNGLVEAPEHPQLVRPRFPVSGSGTLQAFGNELWPALLEKAAAQIYGSWDRLVNGNWLDNGLQILTGNTVKTFYPEGDGDEKAFDFHKMKALLDNDHIMTAATWHMKNAKPGSLIERDALVQNHAYGVQDIDFASRQVVLQNPHGWECDAIRISFEEFNVNFHAAMAARIPEPKAPLDPKRLPEGVDLAANPPVDRRTIPAGDKPQQYIIAPPGGYGYGRVETLDNPIRTIGPM